MEALGRVPSASSIAGHGQAYASQYLRHVSQFAMDTINIQLLS